MKKLLILTVIVIVMFSLLSLTRRIKVEGENRFDSLFKYAVYVEEAPFDWKLAKAVCIVESNVELHKVSFAGALGPMQLMPETAKELKVIDIFDWEDNIRGGVKYLTWQYIHFNVKKKIYGEKELMKFSLASYNGGRGYVSKAIALAKDDKVSSITWENVQGYLKDKRCIVNGKTPHGDWIIQYVGDVMRVYDTLKEGG